MSPGVEQAILELKAAFPQSQVSVEEDGSGGAYVIVDPVTLGPKYVPQQSWMGGHVTGQTPYADVYPLFTGNEVVRADQVAWTAPFSAGQTFRGKPALQISRRSNRLDPTMQTPAKKFQKVLHWMQHAG